MNVPQPSRFKATPPTIRSNGITYKRPRTLKEQQRALAKRGGVPCPCCGVIVRQCPGCGTFFMPRRIDQIYHERKCAVRVAQRRYIARKRAYGLAP